MAANTSIEWTDTTWSPIRVRVRQDAAEIARAKGYTSLVSIAEKMAGRVGPHCEKVSAGCDNCYAATNNHRCLPNNGTGLPYDRRSRDLVEVFVDEKILLQPLTWKKPQKIFVENQSDLFGNWVTDEMRDQVFAVVGLCPQHTFQFLTKRTIEMWDYFHLINLSYRETMIGVQVGKIHLKRTGDPVSEWSGLPLPNAWLGASIEDQETANKRAWTLLKTSAAVRYVSYEPALGPVDFNQGELFCSYWRKGATIGRYLDWVIVGGESGPGARIFRLEWARQVVQQCAESNVACFVKQLGARPKSYAPLEIDVDLHLSDRKGGDMAEWPAELRVRQFPEVKA